MKILRTRLDDHLREKRRAERQASMASYSSAAQTAATGAAGSSGASRKKCVVKSRNVGAYVRPAFKGRQNSPGISRSAGGSGSKSSHAVVCGDSPIRQPGI